LATKYQFVKTISNSRLNASKTLKAQTQYELDKKIAEQKKKWIAQIEKLNIQAKIENEFKRVEELTKEIEYILESYQNILKTSAQTNHVINFDSLLISHEYPLFIYNESAPLLEDYICKHNVPSPSFWEDLLPFIKSTRLKKEEAAKDEYNNAYEQYRSKKELEYQQYLESKGIFEENKKYHNQLFIRIRDGYSSNETESICDYFLLVLENSPLPKGISLDVEINYIPESCTLIVDYMLPNQNAVPRTVSYSFVKTRKEITEKQMSQKDFDAFYDSIIYQLTLKTIHEILSADINNSIATLVFNGYVHGTSLATGNDFTSCIVSLSVTKDDVLRLNLDRVDPKECFRNLKGLSIGALKNLSPVKPYLQFTKNENRFVESRDIITNVENIPNIAKMPWEDFEHLVGGLFEKMFNAHSGEVKVTKASRDGGIDIVIYNPDPIHGGKFVIQAKRYNIVVPVSAVRDLYGTMINEGATKGYLVTTSYFGNDTHKFAQDKPISLIDGSFLVHLFQEHGYTVKISTE
jgi:restriction system protein